MPTPKKRTPKPTTPEEQEPGYVLSPENEVLIARACKAFLKYSEYVKRFGMTMEEPSKRLSEIYKSQIILKNTQGIQVALYNIKPKGRLGRWSPI